MAIKKRPLRLYDARAAIAKALAHPTRLLVLDALRQKDMCVCELTELVGADQSTVSKHLTVLRTTGLVGARKEGAMTYYSLTCPCLDGFFECIESVLQKNLKDFRALVGR
jgi:ArsR family transcriptional regulator